MTNVQPGANPEQRDDSRPAAGEQQHLPCPPWCTVDHAAQDAKQTAQVERIAARTGEVPEWMARWHTCTVAEVHNPEAASQPVKVTLYRDDTLTNPDPDRSVVGAEHADCMAPETAMKVALAIVRASMIATGAADGGRRHPVTDYCEGIGCGCPEATR